MRPSLNPPGETPNVGVPARLAVDMSVAEQHDWVAAFLRARPVSRRSALRGAAGLLAAWGLSPMLAGCGSGGPSLVGRRLSFGGDPRTQMAIAAELTGKPNGKVMVQLGPSADTAVRTEAEVRHLVSMVPQQDGKIRAVEQWYVHHFTDELQAGQTYHYKLILPNGTATPDATFTTAPAAGARTPFTFTAFGDQGVNTPPKLLTGFADAYLPDDTRRAAEPASAMVALIAGRKPAFHLLAGDICYADPSGTGLPVKNNAPKDADTGFNNFDPTTWTTYFAGIEASASTTPWMFATGNHDMEALYDDTGIGHGYGGHAVRLDLPRTGPSKCPSVYTFTYGNVGVLSLDANDLSTEIKTNAGYSGGAQTTWVRQTLTTLRNDPSIDFIVAFFHHCAYATSAKHGSDGGVRDALAPLFDEFSVDLVIQGHNHQYERTNPIRKNATTRQAPDQATVHPADDGTTYICAGSGGRPRYGWQPNETDHYRGSTNPAGAATVNSFKFTADGQKTPESIDWSQTRYLGYAFLSVDVTPGQPGKDSTMIVRAITDQGTEIDTVTLVRTARST